MEPSTAPPTVLGVPLEPGERVLFFDKPSYAKSQVLLWVVGILTLPAVIGILFILMALRLDRIFPRGKFVTNLRVVHVTAKGEAIAVPLHEIRHLEAERRSGDLTSGLFVAAITVTMAVVEDHVANQKAKTDPRYWTSANAVTIVTDRGRLGFASRRAPQLGLFLANLLPNFWANPAAIEQLPSVLYRP